MTKPVAVGLLLGYLADLTFGDPRRGHPVAVYGSVAAALERRMWSDDRRAGIAYLTACIGPPIAAAVLLGRGARRRRGAETAFVGACTWAALGGRSLRAEGQTMAALLATAGPPGFLTDADAPVTAGLAAARARLSHLCSRDATDLGARDLARATVESIAENTSDAVVAPLVWGAIAGAPGIIAYRAVNTLDAMVGYRNERYTNFGWASARLDDALNLLPSRVTALLTVALAPLVGGDPRRAWRAWRDDAAAHPSPNAGPVEAAAAGALGVVLGGANSYGDHIEDRGRLHRSGREVEVHDIERAIRLTGRVTVAALAGCVVLASIDVPTTRRTQRG